MSVSVAHRQDEGARNDSPLALDDDSSLALDNDSPLALDNDSPLALHAICVGRQLRACPAV